VEYGPHEKNVIGLIPGLMGKTCSNKTSTQLKIRMVLYGLQNM